MRRGRTAFHAEARRARRAALGREIRAPQPTKTFWVVDGEGRCAGGERLSLCSAPPRTAAPVAGLGADLRALRVNLLTSPPRRLNAELATTPRARRVRRG